MNKFTLELDQSQAIALRIAVTDRLEALNINMIAETPHATGSLKVIGKWYEEHSHIDHLVRLHTRLTRIFLGHQQYNAKIQFSERRAS